MFLPLCFFFLFSFFNQIWKEMEKWKWKMVRQEEKEDCNTKNLMMRWCVVLKAKLGVEPPHVGAGPWSSPRGHWQDRPYLPRFMVLIHTGIIWCCIWVNHKCCKVGISVSVLTSKQVLDLMSLSSGVSGKRLHNWTAVVLHTAWKTQVKTNSVRFLWIFHNLHNALCCSTYFSVERKWNLCKRNHIQIRQ